MTLAGLGYDVLLMHLPAMSQGCRRCIGPIIDHVVLVLMRSFERRPFHISLRLGEKVSRQGVRSDDREDTTSKYIRLAYGS